MKSLATAAIFFFAAAMLQAAENQFTSSPRQTALVELYTSEGCSSCPPAEAWLSRQKENPGLWKQFVPVAFHVDYWDRLGWRDRFSSKEWTARQSRYASLWGSESVYTPAVVVNGREERGWSSRKLSQPNDKQAGVLRTATSDGRNFSVEFKPAEGGSGNFEAHVALLGSAISSNVRAGENSGRNLKHDFVVLALQSAQMKTENGAERASLTIPAPPEKPPQLGLAVWVTRRGQIEPLQATGGWLATK